MCGEIDEQVLVGQEMLERLQAMAKRLDLPEAGAVAGGAPKDLGEEAGRAAYMERVFRSGLAAAMAEVAAAEEDETVDALALRAIALARLAGFLAGQLPPEADLFRAVIEAVATGHAEPGALTASLLAERDDHHHQHHHNDDGHDHGHRHEHH